MRVARVRRIENHALVAFGVLSLAACGGGQSDCPECSAQVAPMDFTGNSGFYGSPFPSDTRRGALGRVTLTGAPNPNSIALVERVLGLLDDTAAGFGTTSAIYFQLPREVAHAQLPSLAESTQAGATITLLSAEKGSPDYLARYPISVSFLKDGGPFGAPNLLSLLPLQGVPLRPSTRYVAAVSKRLHDIDGEPLPVSEAMRSLSHRTPPLGMSSEAFASYSAGLDALDEGGIELGDLAALTVFTTGSPLDGFHAVVDAMTKAVPKPKQAFVPNEVFDTFCVYETTIEMPDYQAGEPPFSEQGGEWAFDADGKPVLQRLEPARFVVTIPRQPMPTNGFPVVVFSRTGGGGERPLVDRGVRAMPGGPPVDPGTGPAFYFAAAGFAGASIDGPLGGLRNTTHGDEQFLIFNVGNPVALRDNVRQSAAELALEAHILGEVTIDVSACPGATAPNDTAFFDQDTMALMGHSMGATIAPLSLAFEPLFKAGLLSGAGGSWIENVIYKKKPIATKPLAELLLGVTGTGYTLTEWDPLLNLFQWAGEPADPPIYASRIVREPESAPPRHILMMQGIVDTYILPPIANTTSLSLGLDLAGPALDEQEPALDMFAPLRDGLALVGGKTTGLPVIANVTSESGESVTAVVTQHAEDGIENGHEVVFQTDPPKRQYVCFLRGLKSGTPMVPAPGAVFGPCE